MKRQLKQVRPPVNAKAPQAKNVKKTVKKRSKKPLFSLPKHAGKELTKQQKAGVLAFFALFVAALVLLLCLLPRAHSFAPWGGSMQAKTEDGRVLSASPSASVALADGSFLVCDSALHVIWRVSDEGAEIVAGKVGRADANGIVQGAYADGAALEARFDTPTAILAYGNEGGYLISDGYNRVIRYLDLNAGTVITFAGNGKSAPADGTLENASFAFPAGMCTDDAGNIYVADTLGHSVRKIDSSGYVSTFLGKGQGNVDGSFDVASLSYPTDVAYLDGEFFIADRGNAALRVVRAGELFTAFGKADMKSTHFSPEDLTVSDGVLYVTDSANGAVFTYQNGAFSRLISVTDGALCTSCSVKGTRIYATFAACDRLKEAAL